MPLRIAGATSGYVELIANAVGANNTLTIPTVASGSIVAANAAGGISVQSIGASSGSNISIPTGSRILGTDIGSVTAPGSIVQVAYTEYTTNTATSSTSFATLFSCSITPRYSNSLILVNVKAPIFVSSSASAAWGGGVRIMRGATIIEDSMGDSGGTLDAWLNLPVTAAQYKDFFWHSIKFAIDAPATTNQVTYDWQWNVRAGTLRINYDRGNYSPKATMTLWEIKQ